jgi:hypothetical protein
MKRYLVWFSCGAASAYAAKLISQVVIDGTVENLYCDTSKYEHPDNMRFLHDVEKWIGHEIKILNPADYNGGYTDIFDVFDRRRYLVGPYGAQCTVLLKKMVREKYSNPDDIHVIGYTKGEEHRAARFTKVNFEVITRFILIEKGITKRRCLFELQAAGIELPTMYKLGYKNNNCIGCVKGGMGYWNKIRVDFPESFERMARQERKMKATILYDIYLDELEPEKGNYHGERNLECGLFCG